MKKYHATESIIWLIYYKKHAKKETVTYNEAVEEALCFGWIDSTVKRIDDETYMQKYTPRKTKSKWSLVNKNRVIKLINENKMTKAGFALVEIAKQNGEWDKAYSTQKEIELPGYLETALKKNPQAWTNFLNFAQSYRNQYINWIANAKKTETREKRILQLIERCENDQKPGII